MRTLKVIALAAVLLATSAAYFPQSAANHPKVLVIYDMEGVSGAVSPEYTWFRMPAQYNEGRKSLTSDVNAAIRGLKAGGAGPVWVQDGHGSGNPEPDVLLDQLDPRATMDFRTRPFSVYTTGIDASVDAIVCIAMHARGYTEGFVAHTFDLDRGYQINGVDFSETHIVALSAARFGIPVIMVSGDNVLGQQLKDEFPDMEYAVVKTAKSRREAEPLPPQEVQRGIEEAARKGMEKFLAGKFRPYYIAPPYHFVLRFRTVQQANSAARSPLVERDSDYTVRYTSESFVDGFNLSQHVYALSSDRLTLLTRLLQQDPQGKKFLDQVEEMYWKRCLEPGSVPEERPTRGTAPATPARYFGAR